MFSLRSVLVFLVFAFLSASTPACFAADAPPIDRTDPISKALFEEYIVRHGKTPTSDIVAATDLIISRDMSDFWQPALEGLDKTKDWDQMTYVRLLGKMLYVDAADREYKGDITLRQSEIRRLPETVLPELLKHAKDAKDYSLDAYLIAIARARDPRAKDFLTEKLKSSETGGCWQSIKFHSALGLAELGDPTGVEWLINNSEDTSSDVVFAWPLIEDRHLGTSCLNALRVLSGEMNLKTKAEFETWWKNTKQPTKQLWTPKHHVTLIDG
jgi:hypothetical protein